MRYILSFAQDKEDIILYNMLKKIESPVFWIDVGANDPIQISVTKIFSDMGGRGINIEPQRECINALNSDRPNDINVEAGVSDKEGELQLQGEGTGASFNPANIHAQKKKMLTVPVYTLTRICDEYLPEGRDVHFLKVDVEGWEKQVLEGMDFCKYRPWIVCMESTEPGTTIPSWDKWESILIENGYVFSGMSGINRYYMAKEKMELLNDFKDAKELEKEYRIIDYSTIMEELEKWKKEQKYYNRRQNRKQRILKIRYSRFLWPLRKIHQLIKSKPEDC